MLINKRESTGLKYFNDSKTFIECSNDMKDIEDTNPNKKGRILIVFDNMIAVPKNIRLNSAHYFVMKIPNKRKLQQIAFNHSSDIFQGFINLYKKCTAEPYSFLIIDTILEADNSSRFKKNILERI